MSRRKEENCRMTPDDFCTMFRCRTGELGEEFLRELGRVDTSYRPADPEERETYILQVLKRISDPYVARSREENLDAFEKGWRENLALLRENGPTALSLKPLYFRPSPFLRYRDNLIVSGNTGLEYDLFTLARMILFRKHLSGFERIYELGCGSCQNLLMLTEMFPEKSLCGLDWTPASAEIANCLGEILDRRIGGMVFDMMAPPAERIIAPGSAVVTVHALEQIGEKHEGLLRYLHDCRPGLVLHYEPVLEFYREESLLDFLALMYCRRRNYLTGFLTALRRLEAEGKIEILGAWRPHLGGVIHEASLIIWRPAVKKIRRGKA